MDEITLRKEAMRRLLAGEKVTAISRALGKSRYWVKYWDREDGILDENQEGVGEPEEHEPEEEWDEEWDEEWENEE